jgi:acyl-coenzyme A thioesterase PaaI-like protein
MPFSEALSLASLESGKYQAELVRQWTVGDSRLHGGLLLALVTKAGLIELRRSTGADELADPLAVSAEFLRAPEIGPAEVAADVVKVGRTVSVVRVALRQKDRLALSATITAGRLPDTPVEWADLPELPAEPPADAVATADLPNTAPLATACEVRLDPETAVYLRKERGEPVIRGWVRPRGEPTNTLFALVAGDILPPVLFNMGRPGWAPTVQLTALLRGRPQPGWLRLHVASKVVNAGGWFDEDYTVIDSAGRLICQARQLALAPLPR